MKKCLFLVVVMSMGSFYAKAETSDDAVYDRFECAIKIHDRVSGANNANQYRFNVTREYVDSQDWIDGIVGTIGEKKNLTLTDGRVRVNAEFMYEHFVTYESNRPVKASRYICFKASAFKLSHPQDVARLSGICDKLYDGPVPFDPTESYKSVRLYSNGIPEFGSTSGMVGRGVMSETNAQGEVLFADEITVACRVVYQ